MIIEDLIRLGRPLLECEMEPADVLRLVCDAESAKAKNFYRHVIVVEIAAQGKPAAAHQVWGQEVQQGKKRDFAPDVERALGAPFLLPGGNPLHPQGFYGVAAYPCYERHLKEFRESAQCIAKFLAGRLKRTPSVDLDEKQLEQVAASVHQCAEAHIEEKRGEKLLGVLVLADTRGPGSPYEYSEQLGSRDLGRSRVFPGKFTQPNFERLLGYFWEAREREGLEKGERDGGCSICAREAHLVTAYCKSWPWYFPTWNCPLPRGGVEKWMVEGIAVCPQCYRALFYGARLFDRFTRRVQSLVTREIFSPADDLEAKNILSRKGVAELPNIQASGLLLPLLDTEFGDPELREEFAQNVQAMLHPPAREGASLERHLDAVTGFELFLPEGIETSEFRMSLVYFSGDPSRGDIHLRAYIEDVVPSTLRRLRDTGRSAAATASDLRRALYPGASRKQEAYFNLRYASIPFLLARAYGGAYIWDQLQIVLHRRPLTRVRFVHHVAGRLRSIASRYPDSSSDIREEVIFYLSFTEFLAAYRRALLKEGGDIMTMRAWKELLEVVFKAPVENLRLESSAELGFACGALMRQFSRQYYNITKKDYLKQRVLTFGSDLTPRVVWRRGVKQILEVAPRYEQLRLSDDFRQRVGVVLAEYDHLRPENLQDKEEFMASFWSGYTLQGYDRPRKQQQGDAADNTHSDQ